MLATLVSNTFQLFAVLMVANVFNCDGSSVTQMPGTSLENRQQVLISRLHHLLSNVTNKSLELREHDQPSAGDIRDAVELFNLIMQSSRQGSKLDGDGEYEIVDNIRFTATSSDSVRIGLVVSAYAIIVLVSIFGNTLVCHVVVTSRRLHVVVTNIFIANLAVSDLLMTCLNIPFNVTRVLLDNWPFGSFMCAGVPFVQVCSVHVSAFTMVAIALDRYRVIVYPLEPRLSSRQGAAVIAVVWVLAAAVSLPHALFNRLVHVFTFRQLVRCQSRYPSPARQFRKWLTLATCISQYYMPLVITGFAYLAITRRVWRRTVVGAATEEQLQHQTRSKRKTIKMLIVVVVLFAICWLPLNLYHLIVDFSATIGPNKHSSTVFFICHWLAMSNVCCNPFIYCWLNDNFRAGAMSWIRWMARRSSTVYPGIEINGVLVRSLRHRNRHEPSACHTMSSSVRHESIRRLRSFSGDRQRSATQNQEEITLNGYLEVRSPETLAALLQIPNTDEGAQLECTDRANLAATSPVRETGFPLLPRLCERPGADLDSTYDIICRNIAIVYKKDENNLVPGRSDRANLNRPGQQSLRRKAPTNHVTIGIYGDAQKMEDLANERNAADTRIYRASISGTVQEIFQQNDASDNQMQETSFQNEHVQSLVNEDDETLHASRKSI